MKNHVVDNSLKNLGKTVLWQYDRAVRLLSLLKHMQVLYHCAVEQFWNWWTNKVLSVDTCDAFGCSLWGMFLGVPRPTVKNEDGSDRLIATSVYRRLLKGAFYLTTASSSFSDILGYLEIVFGIGGYENLSKWSVYVSEYGWYTNIEELNDEYIVGETYYAGEVVWHHDEGDTVGENWKFTRDVTSKENTSWEATADARVRTKEDTTRSAGRDTLLLKLYDPEGICRKIGGAPNNSLSVSVSYAFGNTTRSATATRRRKCGLTLVDKGNMSISYGKSDYYDEMHRDQKALFEQRLTEFCPFPLGVGDDTLPLEEWVLGFASFNAAEWWGRYQKMKAYAVGDRFVHDYGVGDRLFKVVKKIYIPDNTSFEAISSFISEVSDDVYDEGQENTRYKSGVAYSAGDVFGYVDKFGHGFNYECKVNISASRNTSFDAIKANVEKTIKGDPFVSTFSNESPAWHSIARFYPVLWQYVTNMPVNHYVDFIVASGGILGRLAKISSIDGMDFATIGSIAPDNFAVYVYPSANALGSSVVSSYKAAGYKIVECKTLDELMGIYEYGEEVIPKTEQFSKEQVEDFTSKIWYEDGARIVIDGEKWLLIRNFPSRVFDGNITSVEDFKAHGSLAPKTTLISQATQRRIGQLA